MSHYLYCEFLIFITSLYFSASTEPATGSFFRTHGDIEKTVITAFPLLSQFLYISILIYSELNRPITKLLLCRLFQAVSLLPELQPVHQESKAVQQKSAVMYFQDQGLLS